MKKWVSMLLTVMMLINSVFSPIIALAEEVDTFPTGYAYAAQDVRVFDNIDADGDGTIELAQIGTILAGGYLYVTYVEANGAWADVVFPVDGEVVRAHAQTKELTHVAADGGIPSGLSYNGHELSTVDYQAKHYDVPKATEVPAEGPTAVPTEEPVSEEPEVEEPAVSEPEVPAEEETTEAPEVEAPVEAEATVEPEVEETKEPAVTEPAEDEATEAPKADETEEPEVDETEVPEVEEPVEDETTEEPEADETEEPEVEEPAEDEATEEPEAEEAEEPSDNNNEDIDTGLVEIPLPGITLPDADEEDDQVVAEEPELTDAPAIELPEESQTEEPEAEAEEAEEAEETEDELEEELKEEEEGPTSLTVNYSGIVVTVSADAGVIPAGAELQVAPVADTADLVAKIEAALPEDQELISIEAYDITLLVNGEVVQPGDNVTVNIQSPVAAISAYSAGMSGDEGQTFVYHVGEGGAELVSNMMGVSTSFVFEVPHFSIYAVVVTGTKKNNDKLPQTRSEYEQKNSNKELEFTWVDENGVEHKEKIDVTSPAFDFHIFGDDIDLGGVHTNGNFAGNDVKGNSNFGTNQNKDQGIYEDNYVGNSADGLGKGNGYGSLVVGSDVNVGVSDGNATVGQNGTKQDEMTVYQQHDHTDACYTNGELTCGYSDADWIDIENELKKLSKTSTDLADMGDKMQAKGLDNSNSENVAVNGDAYAYDVIVINIKAKDYIGKKFTFNFDVGAKTVVVNVDMAGVPDGTQLDWVSKVNGRGNGEYNAYYDSTVLWNFYVRDTQTNTNKPWTGKATVGSNDGFLGTILAPEGEVSFGALNGTVIARKANHTGGESHGSRFMGGDTKIKVTKTLFYNGSLAESRHFYFVISDQKGNKVASGRITVNPGETAHTEWIAIPSYNPENTYTIREVDEKGNPVGGEFEIVQGKDGLTVVIGGEHNFSNKRLYVDFFPNVDKTLSGYETPSDPWNHVMKFGFHLRQVSGPQATNASQDAEVQIQENGTKDVPFGAITLKEEGTYVFEVTEDAFDGFKNKTGKVTITVVTEKDSEGKLKIKSVQYNPGSSDGAVIENAADSSVVGVQPKVKKTLQLLNGAWPSDAERTFSFTLTGPTENVYTDSNCTQPFSGSETFDISFGYAATLDRTFSSLYFNTTGEYTFTIKENVPDTYDETKWTYDKSEWTVVVTVGGSEGSLTKSVEYKKNGQTVGGATEAEFVNTCDQPGGGDNPGNDQGDAKVTPRVKKHIWLKKGTPTEDERYDFVFELVDSNGTVIQTVTQNKYERNERTDKWFNTITYTEPGTYEYTIREKQPDGDADGKWTYDTGKVYQYTVTIDGDGNGKVWLAKEEYKLNGQTYDQAEFENVYEGEEDTSSGSGAPKIGVKKVAKAADGKSLPKDAEFEFVLKYTRHPWYGDQNEIIDIQPLTWTPNGENEVTFDLSSFVSRLGDERWSPDSAKFTFEITEIIKSDGWVTNGTVWTVEIGFGFDSYNIKYTVNGTQKDEVVFENTYDGDDEEPGEPEEHTTSFTPDVSKALAGDYSAEDVPEYFEFEISGDNDGGRASLPQAKTVQVKGSDLINGSVSNIFGAITITDKDVTFTPWENSSSSGAWYQFKVREISGNAANWKYDERVFYIGFNVEKTASGELVIQNWTIQYNLDEGNGWKPVSSIEFVNEYTKPEEKKRDVDFDITKRVSKATGSYEPEEKPDFFFVLTDEEGNEVSSKLAGEDWIFGDNQVPFELKDLTAGTYTYTLTETKGEAGNWQYSEASYTVTVTVTDPGDDAELTYTVTFDPALDQDAAHFENTYSDVPEASHPKFNIDVTKTLEGATFADLLEDYTFLVDVQPNNGGFVLPQGSSVPMQRSEVEDQAGTSATVNYGEIEFVKPGEYTITVKEQSGDKKGWTYDQTVYTIEITVKAEPEGSEHLVIESVKVNGKTITEDSMTASFKNTFTAPASKSGSITVVKDVKFAPNSKQVEAKEFSFQLVDEDGKTIIGSTSITWSEDGEKSNTIQLPDYQYGDIGTHTYKLVEVQKTEDGWTYDETEYTVTVEVGYDPDNHELTVSVKVDGQATDSATFTNEYNKQPDAVQPKIDVTKEVVVTAGSEQPTNLTFEFVLSSEDNGALAGVDVHKTITWVEGAANKATFTLPTFTSADIGKTFTYTIHESHANEYGWTYGPDKTVTVTIGQDPVTKELTVTYGGDGASVLFTNTYNKVAQKVQPKIDVTKTVVVAEGSEQPVDTTFEFVLSGNNERAVDGVATSKTITWSGKEGAENKATFVLPEFTEKDAGQTFTYTITESHVTEYGWTYDNVKTVTVTVNYDADTNTLTVTYGGDGASVLFTNNYNKVAQKVQPKIDVTKEVVVAEGSEQPADTTFEFVLSSEDDGALEGVETTRETITWSGEEGAANKATFVLPEFTEKDAGQTFTYTITESHVNEYGWTYDTAKTVTVTVNYNAATNTLTVTYGESGNAVTFTNNYATPKPAKPELDVTKSVTGVNAPAGTFEFVIKGKDNDYSNTFTITVNAGTQSKETTIELPEYKKADIGKTFTYEIYEVEGDELGWSYSKAVYTVTVTVGYDEKKNEVVANVSLSGDEVVFTNGYNEPGETSADVVVTKSVTGANAPAGTFRFVINGENGEYEEKEFTITVGDDGQPVNQPVTLRTYNKGDVGQTYEYVISEVKGSEPGWTYSEQTYRVQVKVTYNEDTNEVEAAVTYLDGAPDFTNNYEEPKPAQPKVDVTKSVNGTNAPAETFKFEIVGVGEGNNYRNTFEIEVGEGAEGNSTTIDLPEYTKADINKTFTYEIRELAGNALGWTYSKVVKTVTVEVTYNAETNKIETKVTVDGGAIAFTNDYEEPKPDQPKLNVTKSVTGTGAPTETFHFTITGKNNNYRNTFDITVDAGDQSNDTTITLPQYTKTDVGNTYVYEVAEVAGNAAGWTYSKVVKTVTVEVTYDDETNAVVANVTIDDVADTSMTFSNAYNEPKSSTPDFGVTKNVTGDNTPAKTFQFTITGEDGKYKDTFTIDVAADGKTASKRVSLRPYIKADIGNTYVYTVAEVDEGTAGWTFDKNTWTVTVKVDYDPEKNEIVTTMTVTGGEIVFSNSYEAKPTKRTLDVTKNVTGADAPDATFQFTLNPSEGDGFTVANAEAEVTYPGEQSASFGEITFTKAGEYEFTIKEVKPDDAGLGWTYDNTVWTVTVTVEDVDSQLTVTKVTYQKNDEAASETGSVVFGNSYAVEPTSIKIKANKTVTGNKEPEGNNAFNFTLTKVSADPEDGYTIVADTVTANKTGNGYATDKDFGIKFTRPGTYEFEIKESDVAAPYHKDARTYTAHVDVVDNDGALSATYTIDGVETDEVEFVNQYSKTEFTPEVDKTMTADDLTKVTRTFDFILTQTNTNATYNDRASATVDADKGEGKATFKALTYDEAGTYTYTITEVKPSDVGHGYVYDETEWTLTVTVTEADDGTLTATGVYSKNGEAVEGQPEFTNSYKADPVDFAPKATKTVKSAISNNFTTNETFSFTLAAADEYAADEVVMSEPLTATVNGAGEATFGNITFKKVGTYEFTITENAGETGGWTYDTESVWTVVVVVTDENGYLKTSVTYTNGDEENEDSAKFENTYTVASTDIEIDVVKSVTGNTEFAPDTVFSFTLTNETANPVDGYEITNDTVKVTKTGSARTPDGRFGIEFTKPGVYDFVIAEGNVADHYTKGSDVRVHVEVKDNEDGTLSATYTVGGVERGDAEFVNQYSETEFTPEVGKTMTADDLTEVTRSFDFTLTGEGVTLTASTTVDAVNGKGTATFETLKFYKAGTYTYTITEDKPAVVGHGYVYDETKWTLTVTVTEAADGTLTATGVYSKNGEDVEGQPEFTNSYKADPVDFAPKATKTVKSAISNNFTTNETFSFTLAAADEYAADEVVMSEPLTATVNGAGEATFGNITFKKAGTYEFTIKENAGETGGWTYDTESVWTVVVDVTDENGYLKTSVTYTKGDEENKDSAKFENTYTVASTEIKIDVDKSVTGNTEVAPDTVFGFTLTNETADPVDGYKITNDTVKVTKAGRDLTPDGRFGIEFTKPGVYEFVIAEGNVADHYTKGSDVRVHVEVVDNKDGTLSATYTVGGEERGDAKFVNQYSETEFTPGVRKTLDTADLTNANKTYGFTLTQIAPEGATDHAETTVTVDATGKGEATFKTLKFYEAGEYKYTIAEIAPETDPTGYVYDRSAWTLTVTVTRADDGTLSAAATYAKNGTDITNDSQAEFTNEYSATGEFQLTLIKVVDGNEVDSPATFTFRVSAVEGTLAENVLPEAIEKSGGSGAVIFDSFDITEAGTYQFKVEEIAGNATGYVYDGQYWIVTVVAEDLNGDGQYTLSVSKTHYTADGEVIGEADDIVFTNHYHKIQEPVEVEKQINGPVPSNRTADFNFTIEQAADNEEGAVLPEQTTLTVSTTGAAAGSAKFGDITFYKAGVYSFIITEVTEGMPNGFTAATPPQTVTITVNENPDTHALYIERVEGQDSKATFTNNYKPGETDIDLKVVKTVNGARDGASKTFSFTLSEVSATVEDGYELTGTTATIEYPAEDLSAAFNTINFTKAGTYVFTISETASGVEDGWTYDDNAWTVTVTVTDNNGQLEASAEYAKTGAKNGDAAIFDNSYEATGDITFEVEKTVNGNPIKASSFVFTLTSSNPETNEQISVKAGTSGKFPAVSFTQPGEYTFTISEETDDTLKGYSFAGPQTITVSVSDDYNGNLVASVNGVDVGESYLVTMTNDYTPAKTDIQLGVTKNVSGAFAPNRDVHFSFVLKEGDTVIETLPVTVLANTTSVSELFEAIEYTEVGTHYYTISEVLPDELEAGFLAYDDTVYNVTVQVDDIGGELKAIVTIDGGSATFTNVYAPKSATFAPSVTKTINGKPVINADFRFELTLTTPANSEAVTMPADTILTITGADTASFGNIEFSEPGDYEFQIVELNDEVTGYGYDKTVWTVKVHVEDQNGVLVATEFAYTANDGQTGDNSATFTNDYAPEATKLTLKVVKDVVNAETSQDKDFGFELSLVNADPSDGVAFTGPVSRWITYPANLSTAFENIEFTKVGTYVFSIRELETSGGAGWSYDADTWTVTVEVADQGGTLSASAAYVKDGTEDVKSEATFVNEYQPKGDITFQIQKNVEGTDSIDTFEFTLKSNDPEVNETISIKAGETLSFSTVEFTEAGEYVFTISETKDPAMKGYTFAADATIVVVVEDDGIGKLWVREKGQPEDTPVIKRTFTNTYAALSTTFAPSVTKVVEGDPAQASEFTFHIALTDPADSEAVVMPEDATVTITGEGTKSFKDIGIEAAGTYVFEITEQQGNDANYSYDTSVWTVRVTVEDVSGQLEVTSVVYANGDDAALTNNSTATFTNTYTEPEPTPSPEPEPTETPTAEPTATPTTEPTPVVTEEPTEAPTEVPTEEPTPEVTATPVPVIPTTNLSGTKTWVDNDNADGMRPAAIEVVLYANGVAQPNVPVWTNTDTNVWTYTFTNLPVTTLNGIPIAYTVSETPVDYYVGTQDGVNFTNTIMERQEVALIDVAGQKTWQDNNNAGNTRPASIVIELQQNGVTIRSTTVTAADNWQYSFTDLPEGDGFGNAYSYTVREQAVTGYYPVYEGMNVTNVLIPATVVTQNNFVTINDQPVARGLPIFTMFNEGELSDMFDLFDYGVPLFGVLLGTGLEVPMYPFVFAGCGALAIVLLIVFGRKKKKD